MAGETLSQDEINALLGNMNADDTPDQSSDSDDLTGKMLTTDEVDALGEIGNISMGTAATTLFALLNHKVLITTPKVSVITTESFKAAITDDLIATSVGYTEGLVGDNLLILKDSDVKIIADLMMGGEGVCSDEPINEFHLSAISEAMNQMIGSSSTSMSQIFGKKIDISPPLAIQLDSARDRLDELLSKDEHLVKVSFRMQVLDNIIDTELMQIMPFSFGKDLVAGLLSANDSSSEPEPQPAPAPPAPQEMPQQQADPNAQMGMPMGDPNMMMNPQMGMGMPMGDPNMMNQQMMMNPQMMGGMGMPMGQMQHVYPAGGAYGYPPQAVYPPDVDIQNAHFQAFDRNQTAAPGAENINILMDVSLDVTVELGRTRKKVREILEYGQGAIIELDRVVGEHIDILVNGKFIAKGEVVVIDENFGIRITSIISPEHRI
ncbi:MAG: hypothetical protein ATN36_00255 [Epulopiscium sp. Nele67-Bin005]|nr:MAG: hypothetical protein ATN36_00255 [Epulopiscium sp. Nele67-Bin005]